MKDKPPWRFETGVVVLAFVLGMGSCSAYNSYLAPSPCAETVKDMVSSDKEPCVELQRELDADAARDYYSEQIDAAHQDGYDEGYDTGYDEGHDAGYDEGYADGEADTLSSIE